MDPVRTCLGCRRHVPRSSLVRIVARNGSAVIDIAASFPGRGAWLHPDSGCIRTAVKRKALGRALRTTITSWPALEELADHEEQAERPMDD